MGGTGSNPHTFNTMTKQLKTAVIVVTHDDKIIPPSRAYPIRDGATHKETGEKRSIDNPSH